VLDPAAFAFDYLFDPDLAAGRHPSDPRFRLACDLYNAGLDRLIRTAQANGRIRPGDTIRLKIHATRHYGYPLTPRLALNIAAHCALVPLPSPFILWLFKRVMRLEMHPPSS
jgi:hypothetical protein